MKKLHPLTARVVHRILVAWWFFRRPNTRGVKCLLVSNADEVLLVKLSYSHRRWSVPGGGVKSSETYAEAAIREIKEELGIVINEADLERIGEYSQFIEYKHDTVVCFATRVSGIDFVIDGREIAEARWFLPSNIPIDSTPSVIKILNMKFSQ